jgi:hypothetical protein
MAKAKKQAKSAAPYIQRLLEDPNVQKQIRGAVGGLRGAYDRVTRKGGKAAEDKRLYANLRQTATSIRNAATALQRPQAQPKRRLQKFAAGALAGGSALLVIKQQKGSSTAKDSAPASEKTSGRAGSRERATTRTG